MNNEREILRSRRSRFFGSLCMALGILSAGFGLFSVTQDTSVGWWGTALGSAIPILMGGFLTAGGSMIAQRRGGLYADDNQYCLYGDSESDVIRLRFNSAKSIYTWELQERFGEIVRPSWVIELILQSGVRVLLGESDDEHGLKHVAHEISNGGPLGAPVLELEETSVPGSSATLPIHAAVESPGRLRVHVGSGGSLARTLLIGGPSMALIGVLLMSSVEHNHVFGFLFGPLFLALGIALCAVPASAMLSTSWLTITDSLISIEHRIGSWSYGRREIPRSSDNYVRIRQRGLLGAGLEIISDGHVLLALNGVHHTTNVKPDGLLAIGAWIADRLK